MILLSFSSFQELRAEIMIHVMLDCSVDITPAIKLEINQSRLQPSEIAC
jgi:hypothetical protein